MTISAAGPKDSPAGSPDRLNFRILSILFGALLIVHAMGGCPADTPGNILELLPDNSVLTGADETTYTEDDNQSPAWQSNIYYNLDYFPDPNGVIAVARIYSDGEQPPPDAICEWAFGEHVYSGPLEDNREVTHTFRQCGRYAVRLSLTIAGLTAPIGCSSTNQGVVTVDPVVSGSVYDNDGHPLAGVRLRVEDAEISTVTGDDGSYSLRIPYESSGILRPEFDGYQFAPHAWTFNNVRADLSDLSFQGTASKFVTRSLNTEPLALSLSEDDSSLITLGAGQANPERLLFNVIYLPLHGILYAGGEAIEESDLPYPVSGAPPTLTYSPDSDYAGADSFVYLMRDIQTGQRAEQEVSLQIQPVNDPPEFKVSERIYANAGQTTDVPLSAVTPGGGGDEAGQAISISLHSSNQSILPDAAAYFHDGLITITPAAVGGPIDLTIAAQDDGGVENGGVDLTEFTIELTVVAGPLVSGRVSPLDLAGADAPIGEVPLKFTGAGDWVGVDLLTATAPDGAYALEMPAGWTGAVSAADPEACLLSPAVRNYDAPITTPLADQDFTAWLSPIGVPMPTFGVFESHYDYAGSTYDFGDGPVAYPDAGAGPYTHYIDNTHPDATDSANPYGAPDRPRMTIPTDWLPPGSVLEIHGGPYTPGWRVPLLAAGTADAPVYVRGVGNPAPLLSPRLAMYGAYMIVENVRADRATIVSTNDYGDVHHLVLRHAELTGSNDDSGFGVANWGDDESVSDVLIWDVNIHDMGDINADFDQDYHGVTINSDVSNAWLLDCRISLCSGSGLQVNAGSLAKQSTTHHIYAGRNLVHECRQSGLFSKQAVDVIFSQNEIHDIITTDWSASKGLGYQYAPESVWFLFNRVYACEHGVCAGSDSGMGAGENIYIVGNVFSNIHDTGDDYNPNTAWAPAAIMLPGGVNRYIVNNTMYDVDAGINGPGAGAYVIQNNIISNVTRGHHVFIELGAAAVNSTLAASILHQNGGAESIRWGSSTIRNLASLQAAVPDQGLGCFNDSPLFANPAAGDFTPQSTSPAIDNAMTCDVYAIFEARYGLSISFDAAGVPRPQDGDGDGSIVWDIGAFEY